MRTTFCFLLFCISTFASNGQLTVKGKVKPHDTLIFNVPFDCWYHKQFSRNIKADEKGNFQIALELDKPQTFFLDLNNKRLLLYGEPNKTLILRQADSLHFSGDIGPENEFRRKTGLTENQLAGKKWNDTLSAPADILEAIHENQEAALLKLKNSEVSDSFKQMTEADIHYFAVSKIRDLMLSTGALTGHNKSKYDLATWRSVSKRAYEEVQVSNADAVGSYHYQIMVANYERYLEDKLTNREEFKKTIEEIFGKSFEEVNTEIKTKGKRYLEYRILNYGFTGTALEYALASFITNAVYHGNLEYLEEAYRDFREKFPDGDYLKHVNLVIKPYLESKNRQQDSKIHFEMNDFVSLDSLIGNFRGQTLYIDMWGTWCGPCREEFAYNRALKEQFAGKNVTFIYLAVEHSKSPEKKWKETINFYGLTGFHFLAGEKLTLDLQKRYGKNGMYFPSYILVNKAGEIVTIRARRPSEKEELYQQINELL